MTRSTDDPMTDQIVNHPDDPIAPMLARSRRPDPQKSHPLKWPDPQTTR
jgi:hypothetical protein